MNSSKSEAIHCIAEQVNSPVSRDLNCRIDDKKCDLGVAAESFRPEIEVELSTTDALDKQKCIALNLVLDTSTELESQPQSQADDEKLDELVDVRVCDICGDVGREALLAICSKCSDGAEHIYCMKVKCDVVPGGEWMCEDCSTPETPSQALELLPTREGAKSPGKLNSGVKNPSLISQSSTKRSCPSLMMNKVVKKRFLGKDVLSKNVSCSVRKVLMNQCSSPKSKNKDIELSGEKSLGKIQSAGAGGSLCKSKPLASSENIKGCFPTKLTKAVSFNGGVGAVHSDASDKKQKNAGDSESPQGNLRKKLLQRSYSLTTNSAVSNFAKVSPDNASSRNKGIAPHHKGNMELLSRKNAHPLLSYSNVSAGSGGEKRRFSPADKAVSRVKPYSSSLLQKDQPELPPAARDASFVVPEHDCIWKGVFKVDKGGKLPNYSSGIQAHVSSCASPSIIDLAIKLPSEIHFTETSGSNCWPILFDKELTEEKIALYFFAEDLDSYKRSYERLLDCLARNDLALKTEIEGFEFLIFPSNVLPVKSQRWNNYLFLWGIFNTRRSSGPENITTSGPDRSEIPNLNVVGSDQELHDAVASRDGPTGGDLPPSPALKKSIQAADFKSVASTGCTYKCVEVKTSLRSLGLDASHDTIESKQIAGNLEQSNDVQMEDGLQNRHSELKHENIVNGYDLNVGDVSEFAVDLDESRRIESSLDAHASQSHQGVIHSEEMDFVGVYGPSLKFLVKEERNDGPDTIEMLEGSRTSRSSLSLDSGGCGPSDSGEWSKSEDWQVDLSDRGPSLELSLGGALSKLAAMDEPVLTLGLASEGAEKPVRLGEDKEEDLSVSLSLALAVQADV